MSEKEQDDAPERIWLLPPPFPKSAQLYAYQELPEHGAIEYLRADLLAAAREIVEDAQNLISGSDDEGKRAIIAKIIGKHCAADAGEVPHIAGRITKDAPQGRCVHGIILTNSCYECRKAKDGDDGPTGCV